jgi:hypothetical protein
LIDSQEADFDLFKIIKCTNLDIKDTACLDIVYILQHSTSCPTAKSTQTAMVNALEMDFLPHPTGEYGNRTRASA